MPEGGPSFTYTDIFTTVLPRKKRRRRKNQEVIVSPLILLQRVTEELDSDWVIQCLRTSPPRPAHRRSAVDHIHRFFFCLRNFARFLGNSVFRPITKHPLSGSRKSCFRTHFPRPTSFSPQNL